MSKMSNRLSASAILEDRSGRVFLLLRGPGAPWMPMRWNLPGGAAERGESPADAAAREVLEEAGLRVRGLFPIEVVPTSFGPHHIFWARRWAGKVRLDFEHADARWVSRRELDRLEVVPTQSAALAAFLRVREKDGLRRE